MEVCRFKTKSGKEAIIRHLTIGDVDEMTRYINELSKEDTYITFSGEVLFRTDEETYVQDCLSAIAQDNKVFLLCFIDDKLVANSDVSRDLISKKRGCHVGIFGITVAAELRGEGVGFELSRQVIDEAKKNIPGLKIIKLNVYEPNTKAQKLYEKLGFKEFGRLPKGIKYKGEYYDEIEMYMSL